MARREVVKQPRALHLVGSLHQGGSERQALQIVGGLAVTRRYHLSVACLDRSGALEGELEALGLGDGGAYPLSSFYNASAVRQLARFSRMLRRTGIDIVQTHDFYSNVFGQIGAALARVSVRIAAKREIDGVRTPAQRQAEMLVYRLAHAVVANSEAVRAYLTREGIPEHKIVVIRNGLDLTRVSPTSDVARPDLRASFGLPPDAPVVVIVANMRLPVKDHPTFLRAARRVRERVPAAVFAIAGEGELAEKVRRLAGELGVGQATFFLGRCRDVAGLIAAADVCVLSSRSEGFSNAILEYMGGAKPVVATDVGGNREAVIEGETGFLVPAGDDEAMAQRIVTLLSNPDMAQAMGTKGRQVVEARFSCEAQLAAVEALYDRLLIRAPRQ
jgi:L-malate glycosyltransferase